MSPSEQIRRLDRILDYPFQVLWSEPCYLFSNHVCAYRAWEDQSESILVNLGCNVRAQAGTEDRRQHCRHCFVHQITRTCVDDDTVFESLNEQYLVCRQTRLTLVKPECCLDPLQLCLVQNMRRGNVVADGSPEPAHFLGDVHLDRYHVSFPARDRGQAGR